MRSFIVQFNPFPFQFVFSVRLDSISIHSICNTSRMRGGTGTNDCWQVPLINPFNQSTQHSLQFIHQIFHFRFSAVGFVTVTVTVYSFMGHVFLSRSSRSSKRRGVSEPSAAKAQLTDHGMGLEPISSCSSRTASRKVDVPVSYIHQRFT